MTSVENVPAYMLPGVPVVQPPNLEGDPSLATEILPGPPPLSTMQRSGLPRKDHKKLAVPVSYLPTSDPGTTYTGHMVTPLTVPMAEVDGPRRKRARLEKGSAAIRAQRASARSLNGPTTIADPVQETAASSSRLIPESDALVMPLDSEPASASRSTSIAPGDEEEESPPQSDVRRSAGVKKDKGKGRAKDGTVRVKEEPSAVVLATSELAPATNRLLNEDHCSSCRSLGSLVYCDGCPRAFHLWCLDPPMEASDLPEGDARWYCPACMAQEKSLSKLPPTLKFVAPLVHQLETSIPVEFQLPTDIRNYFKDVGALPWGTYQDTSEVRLRINRHGQIEEREPYRLKDRNGDPVLCFRCGTSALPPGLAAAVPAAKRARKDVTGGAPAESGRAIVSCDYCHLHWHLDCVEPPLAGLPPWNKKWMCPNHADQIFQPKRRIPRNNATPIEITKPHQRNNGNIEIINPETNDVPPPRMVVDEVLINGRRYRVPERIVRLEFWEKVGKKPPTMSGSLDDASRMSSPLTSLTSLAEDDAIPPSYLPPSLFTMQDVQIAQLLSTLRLHTPAPDHVAKSEGNVNNARIVGQSAPEPLLADNEPASQTISAVKRPRRAAAVRASLRTAAARLGDAEGSQSSRSPALLGDDDDIQMLTEPPPPSISGRGRRGGRRSAMSRNAATSAASRTNGTQPHSAVIVKQEPVQPDLSSLSAMPARPKRARAPRKRKSPEPADSGRTSPDDQPLALTAAIVPPATNGSSSTATTNTRVSARRRPAVKVPDVTPPPPPSKMLASVPSLSAGPSSTKASEATPTLKIRLPRLDSITKTPLPAPSATAASASIDENEPMRRSRAPTRSSSRRGGRRQTSTSNSMNGSGDVS